MKDRKTFFNEAVFIKLAKELYRRYYLKGDFGVSFGVKVFEGLDANPLRSLLGITELAWTKKKRITVAEFEQALKNSVFSWQVIDFVTFIMKKPLVLKIEEEAQLQKRFQDYLSLLDKIDPIFTKTLSEKQLLFWFQKEEHSFRPFHAVAKALQNLPKEYTRLPVFAYQQTGDPHVFDENNVAGILLLQMLQHQAKLGTITENLAVVEEKNQLLQAFYLLRDDIMNYVAIRGLTAEKNGGVNKMWQEACNDYCSWNAPLKEILRMDRIRPFQTDKVMVIENSGIYSILIDLFPDIPMICSSGQFTYAVWVLLRKLAASHTRMYYVGDLDPEGLVMAQTLLNRFPGQMQTIGMNLSNYKIAAQPSNLSEKRLKQLSYIDNPELKEIAAEIIKTKQVGMQEGFLPELISILKNDSDSLMLRS